MRTTAARLAAQIDQANDTLDVLNAKYAQSYGVMQRNVVYRQITEQHSLIADLEMRYAAAIAAESGGNGGTTAVIEFQ